jgi:hypothetical protein
MSDEPALVFTGGAPANGHALKLWRMAQGWTQVQAAAWYGVHERTWRRYELWGPMYLPDRLNKRIQDFHRIKELEATQTGDANGQQ